MVEHPGPEKFGKFLDENNISVRKAAEGLHVSDPTVLDWRNGVKPPTPDHRAAIRIWTNGAVVEDDWPRTKREIKQGLKTAQVKPFEPPAPAVVEDAPASEPRPAPGKEGAA